MNVKILPSFNSLPCFWQSSSDRKGSILSETGFQPHPTIYWTIVEVCVFFGTLIPCVCLLFDGWVSSDGVLGFGSIHFTLSPLYSVSLVVLDLWISQSSSLGLGGGLASRWCRRQALATLAVRSTCRLGRRVFLQVERMWRIADAIRFLRSFWFDRTKAPFFESMTFFLLLPLLGSRTVLQLLLELKVNGFRFRSLFAVRILKAMQMPAPILASWMIAISLPFNLFQVHQSMNETSVSTYQLSKWANAGLPQIRELTEELKNLDQIPAILAHLAEELKNVFPLFVGTWISNQLLTSVNTMHATQFRSSPWMKGCRIIRCIRYW